MRFYEASETIKATPDSIWRVLTDAAGYTRWDSGVDRVDGIIAPGQTITVRSKAAPGRAFPVKVTEFQPATRMTWAGGMPLGLFKGVRTFVLRRVDEGTTHFTVREEYAGPLLGVMWRSMPDLRPSFAQFARGLKVQAEGRR
jgi:hypothetical protein